MLTPQQLAFIQEAGAHIHDHIGPFFTRHTPRQIFLALRGDPYSFCNSFFLTLWQECGPSDLDPAAFTSLIEHLGHPDFRVRFASLLPLFIAMRLPGYQGLVHALQCCDLPDEQRALALRAASALPLYEDPGLLPENEADREALQLCQLLESFGALVEETLADDGRYAHWEHPYGDHDPALQHRSCMDAIDTENALRQIGQQLGVRLARIARDLP